MTASQTTMVVDSVSGFPVTPPYTLSIDADNASKELVEVTAAADTTLTVTRGIDGTSGVIHSLGAVVRHDHSARDFREPQEHIAATTDVHGVSGALVGTSNPQTITGKNFSSGNTFPATLAQVVYVDAGDDAVQASIDAHISDAVDAHDASAISYAGGTGMSATDVEAAIDELATEKANLASPALTGTPTAPTPTAGDNDTSVATTAFVTSAVAVVAAALDATTLGYGTGPTSQTDFTATPATAVTLAATLSATRRYRLTGYIYGTQVTGAGYPNVQLKKDAAAFSPPAHLGPLSTGLIQLAASNAAHASGSYDFTATAGAHTFTMEVGDSANAFRVAAHAGYLTLEDIGPV